MTPKVTVKMAPAKVADVTKARSVIANFIPQGAQLVVSNDATLTLADVKKNLANWWFPKALASEDMPFRDKFVNDARWQNAMLAAFERNGERGFTELLTRLSPLLLQPLEVWGRVVHVEGDQHILQARSWRSEPNGIVESSHFWQRMITSINVDGGLECPDESAFTPHDARRMMPLLSHVTPEHCPGCNAAPGKRHRQLCDVEQCPKCGRQLVVHYLVGIEHSPSDADRLPWTGEWPGDAECREFGWYAKRNPADPGWVPCSADEPGAQPDTNRLYNEATWDRKEKRFIKRENQAEAKEQV